MKDRGIKVSIRPVRIDNGRKQVGYWNSDDFRSDETVASAVASHLCPA